MSSFDSLINIVKLPSTVVSCKHKVWGDTIRAGCQWALPKNVKWSSSDWITTVIKGKAGGGIGVGVLPHVTYEDEIWSKQSSLKITSRTVVYNNMRPALTTLKTHHRGNAVILLDGCMVINRVSKFTLHNPPEVCILILCIWFGWSPSLWYPCCAHHWCLMRINFQFFGTEDTDGNLTTLRQLHDD